MSQDDLKLSVARAAIQYIPEGKIIGVGTGSTANFFIDELARIKIASSERLPPPGQRLTVSPHTALKYSI